MKRTAVVAAVTAVIFAIRVGTLLTPINDRGEPMLSPLAMSMLKVSDPQTALANCDKKHLVALHRELVGQPEDGRLSSTMYYSAELEEMDREEDEAAAEAGAAGYGAEHGGYGSCDEHDAGSEGDAMMADQSAGEGEGEGTDTTGGAADTDDTDETASVASSGTSRGSSFISSSMVPSAILMSSQSGSSSRKNTDMRVKMGWENADKDSEASSDYSAVRVRSITGGRGVHPKGSGSGAKYLQSLTPEVLQRMRKEVLLGIFNRFHTRVEIIGYIELKRRTGMSLGTDMIEV